MRWIIFCKDELLTDVHGRLPEGEACPLPLEPWHHVFRLQAPDGEPYSALRLDAPMHLPGYTQTGLRQAYRLMDAEAYRLAGKARELLHWDAESKYCGVCGTPVKFETEISKRCPECGKELWPQLSTAVIVAVTRGDSLLMVQSRSFRHNYMGLVAGFVETGETLEQAVEREVMEETGICISDIRYFASQPWPFPCGLMVGFTARYASGDITLQRSELRSGGWYTPDAMPAVPGPMSIARRLIDHWLWEQGRPDVIPTLKDF